MVPKIKNILFASKLSENSQYYYKFAIMLTRQLKAKLVIIHILEEFQETYEGIAVALFGESEWHDIIHRNIKNNPGDMTDLEKELNIIQATMDEFCIRANNMLSGPKLDKLKFLIKKGNIARTILLQAKEHNCDLIVMGGKSGFSSETSIGAQTNSVTKNSKIPVVIVPSLFNI